jgi:hypothetical protein
MRSTGRPARRIPGWIYILVPFVNLTRNEWVQMLRQACRVALARGHFPVAPYLYWCTMLTNEELDRRYPKLAYKQFKRTDRIWVFLPDGKQIADLDTFSFNLLAENQRLDNRRPVYRLEVKSGELHPQSFTREDIDCLVRSNLSVGLLEQFV